MAANLPNEIADLKRVLADVARQSASTTPDSGDVVSAIEFASRPEYLGLSLYPRQGTLIKLIAAQPQTFTDYDRGVVAEWTSNYTIGEHEGRVRYVGTRGISPDVMERIEWLRSTGASGFGEVVMVAGRRFSKSYLAAISLLYRLWMILTLDDPQHHFGIDADKLLFVPVMAGSYDRAKRDQFGELVKMIRRAPCFQRYLVSATDSKVSLTTRAGLRRTPAGDTPPVLVQLAAVETTTLSVRGPAIPLVISDEVAHLIGSGSTADFADIYEAMLPATLQFGAHAFVWMGSSPSTKEGGFYDAHCRALTVNLDGTPAHPAMLTVQLESWQTYRDWDLAHTIPVIPDGPCYPRRNEPLLAYDDRLRGLEAENPDSFAVEMRAQWATVLDAYLPPAFVEELFAPLAGRVLVNNAPPIPGVGYFAHADPSRSQAGYGFAIAHTEDVDGVQHVVFDVLHAWQPSAFPDHRIDYETIEDELYEAAIAYNLVELTFDQADSAGTIQRLQKRLADAGRRTAVYCIPETSGRNWMNAETLKTALGQRRVHAPHHPLAEAELRSLKMAGLQRVGPPTSGPVTTCDIADCIIAVVRAASDQTSDRAVFDQFKRLRVTGISIIRYPSSLDRRSRPGRRPRGFN